MAELLARFRLGMPKKGVLRKIRQSSLTTSTYQFIDPLIACNVSEKKSAIEFIPLKTKINELINNKISAKQISTVSVYFDKRDGNWFSINPNEKFFPASLMKVPTMIAFLKLAETHPEVLSKKILFDGSLDLNKIEYFKPTKVLEPHHYYTVDDLLFRMIAFSDNNAIPLLVENIDNKTLNEVYTDLGITIPQGENTTLEDYLTVKQYATFFRVLHNSTYLNREMSEKALTLLSQVDFPRGIAAGLPANIGFANKFGERNFSETNDERASQKELHDCGIVYYPNHPYLLCVMTKGTNFEYLTDTLKDISKLVYGYIDGEASK